MKVEIISVAEIEFKEAVAYMLVIGSVSALINAYIAFEVIRRMGDNLWLD